MLNEKKSITISKGSAITCGKTAGNAIVIEIGEVDITVYNEDGKTKQIWRMERPVFLLDKEQAEEVSEVILLELHRRDKEE